MDETGMYVGWSDGACIGNPGPMGIGGTLRDPDGNEIAQFSIPLCHGTNNEAEYRALHQLLALAIACDAGSLHAHTDSELVAKQYSGEYKVHQENIQQLLDELKWFSKCLPGGLTVEWVPRSKNCIADALAGRAAQRARRQTSKH